MRKGRRSLLKRTILLATEWTRKSTEQRKIAKALRRRLVLSFLTGLLIVNIIVMMVSMTKKERKYSSAHKMLISSVC